MEKGNRNSNVLKEAEMIIEKYVSKIEEKEKLKTINEGANKKLKRKYKLLKKYAILSTLLLIISLIINFV